MLTTSADFSVQASLALSSQLRASTRRQSSARRAESVINWHAVPLPPFHLSAGDAAAVRQRAGAAGARHFSPGNRAWSRSSVIHSQPHSIARAAYDVSERPFTSERII